MSTFARFTSFLVIMAFGNYALAADATTRPNVVLMMADDLGWGEVGYHGHPLLKTPTLDAMAATALRLDRFYAAAPVCSPTRASVLTGRHPNRSGVFAPNYSTRPEEITLAQILKNAGYRTGHFGKWHVGAVKAASPTNPARMGFEEYLSHDNFFEMDPMLSHNGADPEQHKGESSEIIVDAALEFIGKVQSEQKPFFVIVWFGSPHGPYSGLKKDLDLYADAPNDEMQARFAEITAMDRAIGEFRDALRTKGIADNTLLWFNSDNGCPVGNEKLSFNGGWRGKKSTVYEGGLLVPAVIEWPSMIREPRQSDVHCVTSDIFPTVLDFLGLASPDPKRPIDGISLRNLIASDTMAERPSPIGFWKYSAGPEKKNGRYLDEELTRGTTPTAKNPAIDFMNFRHPVAKTEDFGGEAAWTDNRYKLLVSDNGKRETTALYDLLDDPKEEHDIAADNPKVVKKMTKQLHEWQTSVERSLSGADY